MSKLRFKKQTNQEVFEKFKLNSFKSKKKPQRQQGERLAAHGEEEDDMALVHGKKALLEENCPVLRAPSSDKGYRDKVVDLTEEEVSFCSKIGRYSCYGKSAEKKSDMGKWQKVATVDFQRNNNAQASTFKNRFHLLTTQESQVSVNAQGSRVNVSMNKSVTVNAQGSCVNVSVNKSDSGPGLVSKNHFNVVTKGPMRKLKMDDRKKGPQGLG